MYVPRSRTRGSKSPVLTGSQRNATSALFFVAEDDASEDDASEDDAFGFPDSDSDSESDDSSYAESAETAAKKAADRAKEAAEKERLRLLKIAKFPPGSRVLVAGFPGAGVVRYYGERDGTNKPNEYQYGVELELPEGKNKGNQLFLCTVCPASCGQPWPRNSGGACKAKHGVLVAPDKVHGQNADAMCARRVHQHRACPISPRSAPMFECPLLYAALHMSAALANR